MKIYCDRPKSVKNAKEAPCNLGQALPASKQLNLKSLAMQTGPKFSGCPTPADSHFLGGRSIHDPTQKNKQGPDIGSQYRSAIFTHNEKQAEAARRKKESLGKKVVTEIVSVGPFYRAEEHHQRYHDKHGGACGL